MSEKPDQFKGYTPGPWRIRAERYKFIRVYATLGGIAHLDTVDSEGMENARLIAAAPSLLADNERLTADNEALRRDAERWKEALHRISLASQNSMSGKDECGRIARTALQGDKT